MNFGKMVLKVGQILTNSEVRNKPGRAKFVADALSRAPVGQLEVHTVTIHDHDEQDMLTARIQEQQGSNVEVKQLLDYVDKRIQSNLHYPNLQYLGTSV